MKKSNKATAEFQAYYELFKSILKNEKESESPFEDVDDKYLRIDFVHYGSPKYQNGGWVQMNARTYIQPVGSEKKYYMVGTNNMPIAPDKHCYKCKGDILIYSLFFPKLPSDVTHIDIIENKRLKNAFNLYNVSLETIQNTIIPVLI
jgi:hypothetical protein